MEDLRPRVRELVESMGRLTRENEALRQENVKLRKEAEEWRRGHRERSKRWCSRPR